MEYTFRNIKTGKIVTHEMRVSEYDVFKEQNPQLERYFESAPAMSYRGSTDFKTDNTWKEVMAKIGEQNPSSQIADQYVRKTTKQVKTRQIIEKHVKKAQKAGKI
jgi:hypothetical protein